MLAKTAYHFGVPVTDARPSDRQPTGRPDRPTTGVVSWGVYLPRWRLDRQAVGAALRAGGGTGWRAVAGFDEDTTTMAVEAARRALVGAGGPPVELLLLSTPAPVYEDRTNATTVHAALGLDPTAMCGDCCGAVRSGWTATMAAMAGAGATAGGPTAATHVAVVSDLRSGLPGGPDERAAGDGAGALVFGPDPAAELIGRASASDELLDRWRAPGEPAAHLWEERFGEEVLVPLAVDALQRACKAAGTTTAALDRLVVAGLAERVNRAVVAALDVAGVEVVAGWVPTIGNLGAAQAPVGLADALERSAPGQTVGVLQVADGADAAVWRVTDRLPEVLEQRRQRGLASVTELLAEPTLPVAYLDYLSWRGLLVREPPRRPEPERPGAPVMHRSTAWKYGFTGSRCTACGFRHLPPTRVCLRCRAVDRMVPDRLAETVGTLAAYTVDRLAYTPAPPLVGGIVDFDGGGRFRGQLTDVDADRLAVGQPVDMVFRRLSTSQGVHNYFWKARPTAATLASTGGSDDR